MIIYKELHGFRQITDSDWLDQSDPTKTIPVVVSPCFDPYGRTIGTELRVASEDAQDQNSEEICYVFSDADPDQTCECAYCTEVLKVICL